MKYKIEIWLIVVFLKYFDNICKNILDIFFVEIYYDLLLCGSYLYYLIIVCICLLSYFFMF